MIRRATDADTGRIAEILVFNNRIFYSPIFRDLWFSFGEYTVLAACREVRSSPEFAGGVYVWDDGVIRGFAAVVGHELTKLYVDPFFQHQGIGAHLPDYAVKTCGARTLWALEKNEGALRFYARHGFKPAGEWQYEAGTTERLVRLERKEYKRVRKS